MENICKNCKYFKPNTRQASYVGDLDGDGFGECISPKIIDDSGDKDDLIRDTSCIVATCDEQRGSLYIGENFGCIHFVKI